MTLYQYAKSADPEVVRIALANRDGRNDLMRRAQAWAKERGCESAYYSSFAGRWAVSGLPSEPSGRGRWTGRGGVWRPFKNNKAEDAALSVLTFADEMVPGLPQMVWGRPNRDGSRPVASPRPFVWQDVAYVGLTLTPDPRESENREGYGPQWVEILASEFYAAEEALTGKAVAR